MQYSLSENYHYLVIRKTHFSEKKFDKKKENGTEIL